MARMGRVVVPGETHHAARRGVRRMESFFGEADDQAHLERGSARAEARARTGVACRAYCPMPNHLHPIPVERARPSRGPGRSVVRGGGDVGTGGAMGGRTWPALLAAADDEAAPARFRSHAGTGRPLGDATILVRLEAETGPTLAARPPAKDRNGSAARQRSRRKTSNCPRNWQELRPSRRNETEVDPGRRDHQPIVR